MATEPTKKEAWGDSQPDPVDDAPLASLSLSTEGIVDTPSKSDKLNDEVEAPDTKVEKDLVQVDTPYTSAKTFEDLNLSAELLRGIYSEVKFEKPSKIQAETLPMILTPPYHNLVAQAHNGSGKTTCFVLGMLSRVDPAIKAPQALCVCPTRELAIQNDAVLIKVAKYTGITSVCAIPADRSNSSASTRRGRVYDQVVIGTPGTIKRWMTVDKILPTKDIGILVFDEADHMLDRDGFQDDSLRILREIKKTRANCQILLFSATFSERVKDFVSRSIPSPNRVFVKKEDLSLDVIKQYRVKCPGNKEKIEVLRDRIFPLAEKIGQSIIFARTRENVLELHRKLAEDGHRCTSIQGGMTVEDRDLVIQEFRSGVTKILIATDVLARGFDHSQVNLVANFDLPVKHNDPKTPDYEVYLHRIGRSGRFGRKGAAFNLVVSTQEEHMLDMIERHFNHQITEVPWDDEDAFEVVLKDAGLA